MTESSSNRLPDHLYQAIAHIPVAVFVLIEASGRFQYVNDVFADLLNTTPVSLIGDEHTASANVADMIHPDDRSSVSRWLDPTTDDSLLDEIRFQKTDGQWTKLRIKLRRTVSTGHAVERILIGTADAIAKPCDDELAFHREFEHLIVGASARFVNSISDGVDQNVNRILEEVCRLIPLQQCHLVQVHDKKPAKLSITHEYRQNGQPSALGDFRFVPVHVVPWLYKQIDRSENLKIGNVDALPEETGFVKKLLRGNKVRSYIIIPLASEGGRPCGYLGLVPSESGTRVWRDDTLALVRSVCELIYGWLKRAQEDQKIKKNQLQWSSIASAASDLLAIVDAEGNIQDARFGVTEVAGQSIYNIVTPKFRKPLRIHLNEILADTTHSTIRDFEYVGYSPEGKENWYRGRLRPHVIDYENCVSLVATSIQAHKEAEERSQALQSELEYATRLTLLGNMSVEVAHQFHQPLQVIESYIDGCRNLLKRDRASRTSLERAFDGVSKAVRRASQIISQLQHFMTRQKRRTQATSINTIAENAIRLAEAAISRHNVDLQQELRHGLPAVNVDQLQIMHVVLNLILNGIEAATAGRFGNAALCVATSLQTDNSIRVSVVDNGRGIPEEHISKIFEQFYTTKEGGLGLGLAQSRNIIETHHGRLWIESSDESGTELCLELPTVDSVGHDTAELEIVTAAHLAAFDKENAATTGDG